MTSFKLVSRHYIPGLCKPYHGSKTFHAEKGKRVDIKHKLQNANKII